MSDLIERANARHQRILGMKRSDTLTLSAADARTLMEAHENDVRNGERRLIACEAKVDVAEAAARAAGEKAGRLEAALPLWRHFKGGLYREIARGSIEANGEPVVVYRSESDGRVWVRSTVVFEGSTISGEPRFAPVTDAALAHPATKARKTLAERVAEPGLCGGRRRGP